MITIHLPDMLRNGGPAVLELRDPVANAGDLIDVLAGRLADFTRYLEDGLLNFAINDEMVLVRLRERVLHDGDEVEIIPTISGG